MKIFDHFFFDRKNIVKKKRKNDWTFLVEKKDRKKMIEKNVEKKWLKKNDRKKLIGKNIEKKWLKKMIEKKWSKKWSKKNPKISRSSARCNFFQNWFLTAPPGGIWWETMFLSNAFARLSPECTVLLLFWFA